ncbi:hypothetical protein [Marinobacterium sediminicola]|uniref:Phage shock protein B n=1 Tax=Marinobacterium sediminicola TaxID=518898 RepID=A0ABY1RX71_9GAMM|nr:hypothetical protein [Marinobacterium sediminicola]ULG67873.1 hypothetical protein LN244_09065 [Marinobacterium sediminicola]SMR71425.1 hypothetical protein SAMN04487964_102101 [Marinobacterium sediminicola]
MDALSIFIIVLSVILAVAFKWVLIRKIRHWMDQDLINQLAGGSQALKDRLHEHHQQLLTQGVKRSELHERLQEFARDSEPAQD